MPNRSARASALMLALVLGCFGGAQGETAANASKPGNEAAAGATNIVSVLPQTTVRGSTFQIFVQGAPPGASVVSVQLDGRKIDSGVPDPKNPGAIVATVPATVNPADASFIPLGAHHVAVLFDGRWYASGTTLTVVRSEQSAPVLRSVAPLEFTPHEKGGEMVLTGSGFVTDAPDDNKVSVDGTILPIVWDGCAHPQSWSKDSANLPHGTVDGSGSRITICNFDLPASATAEVQVHQGILQSNALTLHVPPWHKGTIILMSVGVNLFCVAAVLLLAWFIREARIGNERYGVFRILFLDPETNTYSLSKYQFYMWTGAAIFTYAYLAISHIFVQELSLPDVPSTLPGIIGLGAGTSIGSQLLTNLRGPKGGGPEKPSLGDFVSSGGVVAPERVQMFVWTTVGVLGFCFATLRANPWDISGLPQVGSGLLMLMGISSAGYLGGKLARKPGPVINEISVSPARADNSGSQASAGTGAAGSAALDLSQPIGSAQTVLTQAQATMSTLGTSGSNAALKACEDAVEALRLSVKAATSADGETVATLNAGAVNADLAARAAADVFSSEGAGAGDETRQLAELAERCASAAQDLASGVGQAMGSAQGTAAVEATAAAAAPAGVRSIDLRGRNLSRDATFEINDSELPFRMLALIEGSRRPTVVAPEDDPNAADMARELRLTIAPAMLGSSDRASYDAWFSKPNVPLTFSITNPDGQRSELSFKMPPGANQSNA